MSPGHGQIIAWYPGHMAAAMRKIEQHMKLVDIVIEVIDARVPRSGANPVLDALAGKRPRLILLSREDLADSRSTVKWLSYFNSQGKGALAINGRKQSSVAKAKLHLEQIVKRTQYAQRAMVVGLPNTGKSAVINGLLRRAAAKTANRPGVTRATQWFRVAPELELMDTPGILIPKIDSPQAQWMLALTGAIPRERFDPQDVSERFHLWLSQKTEGRTSVPDLTTFANARGFLGRGNLVDMHNAATSYLKEFNEGRFGRITFELPVNDVKATKE
ncbi:MAG: ribosome biogenesis GTPase YlqF [Candidatus Eremiobacteraeota bacterium]|nr:ribosome biogenesis GTPase YlqF [Candidatus Eremiobacteraeota bacterium]